MAAVVAANPFAERARQPGRRHLPRRARRQTTRSTSAKNVADERLALGKREIYVALSERAGPLAASAFRRRRPGTARNMNTVAKLAELAREMA